MKTFPEIRPNLTAAILFLGLTVGKWASAADLHVPSTSYPTIQAAVDAAKTNDAIRIAPGVYTEQVQIISKALTLIGQPGTILRATETMSMPPDSINFSIIFVRYSQVTFRGLTFEGERLAERFTGSGELIGIALRQSSGNVENCAFYGFRESTPSEKSADAIFVFNAEDDATEVNVRVIGSTFADSYGSLWFYGSDGKKNINVTVENNTIVGPGPLGNDTTYGIFVREGVAGRIAGNTISGYSYVGTNADFPISYGIIADNEANLPEYGIIQPLEIEGNTLRDNQVHIALINGNDSVVRDNRFQGTAPGILPLGMAVTGTNVTIANNQFENMPEGIRLFGNDPSWGTLLGLTINAQVTSNRFCNVPTPITVQPLSSATQVGSLLGSCSPNTLTISPAVLVSWPIAEDGWIIESAASLDGPWSISGAASFVQNGVRNVAVPAGGGRLFFRADQKPQP